jgi:hypothetical protein
MMTPPVVVQAIGNDKKYPFASDGAILKCFSALNVLGRLPSIRNLPHSRSGQDVDLEELLTARQKKDKL